MGFPCSVIIPYSLVSSFLIIVRFLSCSSICPIFFSAFSFSSPVKSVLFKYRNVDLVFSKSVKDKELILSTFILFINLFGLALISCKSSSLIESRIFSALVLSDISDSKNTLPRSKKILSFSSSFFSCFLFKVLSNCCFSASLIFLVLS